MKEIYNVRSRDLWTIIFDQHIPFTCTATQPAPGLLALFKHLSRQRSGSLRRISCLLNANIPRAYWPQALLLRLPSRRMRIDLPSHSSSLESDQWQEVRFVSPCEANEKFISTTGNPRKTIAELITAPKESTKGFRFYMVRKACACMWKEIQSRRPQNRREILFAQLRHTIISLLRNSSLGSGSCGGSVYMILHT